MSVPNNVAVNSALQFRYDIYFAV